jgi:hypothetical protein|tara:strand:- start:785 stop:994 length:210 start_codon:yes stop_codon:yes gene_type:complete
MRRLIMSNTKLTSVKILKHLYNSFKVATVNTKMTLQKITNRSVHLYMTDEKYRDKIETMDELNISGSNF